MTENTKKGKNQKDQAIAAALSIARKARASGGSVKHLPSPSTLNIPEAPNKAQMDRHGYEFDVPLHKARATQTTMDWREKGERVSPGPLIKGYAHKPVAVRRENGEYLVYDGHHRTVRAINEGRKKLPMHVIDAKIYDPANAGRPPARQGLSDDELLEALGGRKARASGGSVKTTFAGPIHSHVAGRTDHLPMHVESGSYVIPADVVSAYGEGNTLAGFKALRRLFGGTPYEDTATPYEGKGGPYNESLPHKAAGGATSKVPVVVAGGEYTLSPYQIRMAGGGDLDTGHRVLDEFIKRSRKELIDTLRKLPGPKKS